MEFCVTKHKTMDSLTGNTVLVLGGSTGIGLAVAKLAAAQGAKVSIVSSNQQKINEALKELPAGSQGFVVNLADEAAIKAFFATADAIDHLVYTAGENLQLSETATLDIAAATKFWNIRYWGAVAAVKYGAPKIKGSIVLTAGSAGTKPGKGWGVGTSICAAVEAHVKVLALELAPVRVNVVSPGMVMTNLWDNIPGKEEMYEQAAASLPVGFVAKPEDIAASYVHLMAQRYITGQRILIDGGWVLM
jgi:NAD(P)-dependent dehydrogenase (short-subunit alcohol dehydrogenase family)